MKRFQTSREAGFTLIEIIVAIVIISILSAVAIPSYRDYVERSKVPEAIANLSAGRVKMEQWFLDSRDYSTSPVCVAGYFSDAKYFTYACSSLAPTTYTITATGVASGGMGGFTYTINESNVKTSVFTSPASDNGWTAPSTNCWAVKKGGIC